MSGQNVMEELRKRRLAVLRDKGQPEYHQPGKRERTVAKRPYGYARLQREFAAGKSQRFTLAMAFYEHFRAGGGI